MRQDPDVILVGELRDAETIQMAMTAAETGHLVLGTLHTTGARQDDRSDHRRTARASCASKPRVSSHKSLKAVVTQVL